MITIATIFASCEAAAKRSIAACLRSCQLSSSLTPSELCNVIANGDERILKGVKGIGLKTAQRIIVDLKDKILSLGIAEELHVSSTPGAPTVDMGVRDEAVAALTMLGFSPAPAAKVVTQIMTAEPDLPVEMVVKQALKQIK